MCMSQDAKILKVASVTRQINIALMLACAKIAKTPKLLANVEIYATNPVLVGVLHWTA